MLDLAKHQKDLLSLIKSGEAAAAISDPYIGTVAASDGLAVLREVVLSWRAFDVKRYCRLTSSLLKQRGVFDQAVARFAATANLSPFIERLGEAFLEMMSWDSDPLTAAVARFESGLIKVTAGDTGEYAVDWPTDPRPVLLSLRDDRPLEAVTILDPHQTLISGRYPGLVRFAAAPSSR